MKIIGQAGDGYMVTLTADELANVMGKSSKYDGNFRRHIENAITSGVTFDIDRIYKRYSLLVEGLSKASYDTARAKLERMLNQLTPIEDILEKAAAKAEKIIDGKVDDDGE